MKRIGAGTLALCALMFWSACSEEKPMTTTAPAVSAAVLQTDGNNGRGDGRGSVDDAGAPDMRFVASIVHPNHGVNSASASIGREGGTLRLDDFQIVVPAGAVDHPTLFSIKLKDVGANGKRAAMAEFGPHNQTFNVPVTVILPWSSTDAAGVRAHIIWWDQTTWVGMPTQFTRDGRVRTQTIHLSFWATCGLTVAGG